MAQPPISAATARQKELEALALRLSQAPEVLKAREAAREIFLAHPNARTPDGAASLEDAATQHFYGALQLATNEDPHYPLISTLFMYRHETDGQAFPSALHGGLENPDNVYRIIPVSSDSRYELRGVRHSPAPSQVTYELMDSIPGIDSIGEQIALLMDRDMVLAEDGAFTITIDPDPAAGRANHIQTTPAAKCLFIRDSLLDWTTQAADQLTLVRLAGPETPPRTEEELIARAVKLIPHYAQFWQDLRDHYVPMLKIKTNAFDAPYARTGGWGFIGNSHFDIASDEALVFTADPRPAPYHAVLIGNHWWIALDADRRSGAFNTAQAQPNADGTITYVVAAQDPGVHNWLDTGGLTTGIIQVRWQGAPAEIIALPDAITDVRLVKLDELKSHMRPETVWLTPQEREAQQADRHASYCLRLSPP